MQERNSEKVVSLSVRATKVTANVLKSAVRAYLSAQKNKSPNCSWCWSWRMGRNQPSRRLR